MNTPSADPPADQAPNRPNVHKVFSQKVADYLKSRPDYPLALFEQLTELGALSAGAIVADIGSGTGLLTGALLQRGHEVFALEPNDEMRAAAEANLQSFDRFRSRSGSAEVTGLTNASIDLVTAAQAFHWFDAPRARDECLRILRPQGQVALIWNDRVLTDVLNQALDRVFAAFGGELRKVSMQQEERRQVPEFFGHAAYQTLSIEHKHWLDRAGFAALVFSRSYMPKRGSAAALEVEGEISRIFDKHAQAGQVLMRYQTLALVGRPDGRPEAGQALKPS
jgi:SAM-dependent methyltransferase